jgi:hypothetical protein
MTMTRNKIVQTMTVATVAAMAMVLISLPASLEAGTAPQIEVCFVLDTTGSMGGLIEGAKAKIWSIANQMVAAKPTPELRIALVAYRDRGDDYVTRLFDLSDDIDAVYENLQSFRASGGGDTPESVNQALHEAVTKVSWSGDKNVLKIIFLVGDCPPHMDYQDDVKYDETCQLAVRRDLIINTVQCGKHAATTPIWQEIGRLAEGSFVAIGQTGDMEIINTPMDEKLAELNVAIGATLLPYGNREQQRKVMAKQAAAESAAAPAAADRLAYNMATSKVVQGGGDLVDDLKDGAVQLEDLDGDELPPALRGLSPEKQQAYIDTQAEKRAKIQAEINELIKQRKAYIEARMRELASSGGGSAFDQQVTRMIQEQAGRKGISYGEK